MKKHNYIVDIEVKKQACEMVRDFILSGKSSKEAISITSSLFDGYSETAFRNWDKELGGIFTGLSFENFSTEEKKKILNEVKEYKEKNDVSITDAVSIIASKYDVRRKRILWWNLTFKVFDANPYLSDEERIKILNEIKNYSEKNNVLISKAALKISEKYNISKVSLYEWNLKFNIFETSISDEKKIEILNEVKDYSKKNKESFYISSEVIASKYNITRDTLYNWNMIFKIFETEAVNKNYDKEEKRKICVIISEILIATDLSCSNVVKIVSERFNVSPVSVYEWNREFKIFSTRKVHSEKEKVFYLDEALKIQQETGLETKDIFKMIEAKGGPEKSSLYKWNREFDPPKLKVKKSSKKRGISFDEKKSLLQEVVDFYESIEKKEHRGRFEKKDITIAINYIAEKSGYSYESFIRWNNQIKKQTGEPIIKYFLTKNTKEPFVQGIASLPAEFNVFSR